MIGSKRDADGDFWSTGDNQLHDLEGMRNFKAGPRAELAPKQWVKVPAPRGME